MKKLITICAVVALVLAVSGLVQAGTIASDPDYKASTDLSIGPVTTVHVGHPDYELTGFGISAEFQINLLYQAGILDSDIDNINHYWDPMGWTYNFGDNDEYVLNVSATGGLTIYEFDGMAETPGGSEIKWTLTAWHQTILAGDIIDNGDGTITLQVLPVGTYRPFVNDPPVNNVEVFDGDLNCEVLGYTFTGAISGIGNGSVLSVNLAPAPTEVWVDDDFDNSTPGWGTTHFATIQDGVDAVADGGTVNVYAGTYNEHVVISNPKSIQVKGEAGAIVDGGGTGNCFTVAGNGIVITGFTIQNAQFGIWANGDKNKFAHNVIHDINWVSSWSDGGLGICIWDPTEPSEHNKIEHNEIYDCNRGGILVMAAGSASFSNSKNKVKNNHVHDISGASSIGIEVTNSINCQVTGNKVSNVDYGIYIYAWGDPKGDNGRHKITKNNVEDITYYGYALVSNQWMTPSNPLIPLTKNKFKDNHATNCGYHGLFMEEAYKNTIEKNNFTGSGYHGIYMYNGSDENKVKKNNCDSNAWDGIKVRGDNNKFEKNHAMSNGNCDLEDLGVGNVWKGNIYGTFCP